VRVHVAVPNPVAVEKLREEEAASATPHAPQHKVRFLGVFLACW